MEFPRRGLELVGEVPCRERALLALHFVLEGRSLFRGWVLAQIETACPGKRAPCESCGDDVLARRREIPAHEGGAVPPRWRPVQPNALVADPEDAATAAVVQAAECEPAPVQQIVTQRGPRVASQGLEQFIDQDAGRSSSQGARASAMHGARR